MVGGLFYSLYYIKEDITCKRGDIVGTLFDISVFEEITNALLIGIWGHEWGH